MSVVEITVAITVGGVQMPIVVGLDAAGVRTLAAAVSPSEQPSPYLSVEEAAAFLRTSRQRIYDLCSSGRLERVKEGARTLIRRADIEAHLAHERTRTGARMS